MSSRNRVCTALWAAIWAAIWAGMVPVLGIVQAQAAGAGAGQVTVWRCGADGRSFSDRPCNDGRSTELQFDAPGAGRQAEAQAVARREAGAAAQLRRERLQRQRLALRETPNLATLGPVQALVRPERPTDRPKLRPGPERDPQDWGPERPVQAQREARSRAQASDPDKAARTSPAVRHASRQTPG